MAMNDRTEADAKAAWDAGYRFGLEQAARRVERLSGQYAFLVGPPVVASEIRALKGK
jgi:plasmid stabilization system protein ParE